VLVNGVPIEEELSTSIGPQFKEIASSDGDPVEDRVTGSSLQNEQGNDLLNEETDDDGWPNQAFNAFSENRNLQTYQGTCFLCTEERYRLTGRQRDRRRRWHGHRSWSPLGKSGSGKRANFER
jgi:hypothetical protein